MFADLNPFVLFKLKILPASTHLDKLLPPFFATELVSQNFSQCPGKNVTMWSFTMPKSIDPQNQTVTMSLTFDKAFFAYDGNSKTI